MHGNSNIKFNKCEFTLDLILQQKLGNLNIQDLALSCIQFVPTFVTGYMSNATFSLEVYRNFSSVLVNTIYFHPEYSEYNVS